MGGLFGDAKAADLTDAQRKDLMNAVSSLMKSKPTEPPYVVKATPETILSIARHRGVERRNPTAVYMPGGNQVFWRADRDEEQNIDLMAHEFAHAVQHRDGRPMSEAEAEWVQRKIGSFPKGRKQE